MPQFVPQRSPRPTVSGAGAAGATAARLARQLQQFHRQHSSPAQLEEGQAQSAAEFGDTVSLRSVIAWSTFGDIDTESKEKSEKLQLQNEHQQHSPDTLHQFMGKLFQTDMFNVFLSLAKDGTNGAVPFAGAGGTNNKEQLAVAVYKQYKAKKKLMEPYKRLRTTLKHMQQEYAESKAQNLLMRYTHMQKMIHEVIIMERQHWHQLTMDLPPQAISETPQAYVLRIAALLDDEIKEMPPSTPRPGSAIAHLLGSTICIAERTKDSTMYAAMRAKSMDELREQCAQLSTELYRLIHKYQALRVAVRELTRAYQHARYYPLVPRYNLLKAMIKRILRTPAVIEADPILNE